MYAPYPENMMESIKKVEATRAERMATEPKRLTRKNILQGKHRHIMSHQHTSLTTGIAPYHLGRGIFGNQLRIICFQLFQL